MDSHSEIEQAHLTDEQFAELLLGANPSAVQEHLKACVQCAEEAERVSGAIGSFERHTRLWAERRAAARPALAPARPPVFAWLYRPQAWTAAALALALAVGVTITARNHRSAAAQAGVAQTAAAPAMQTPAVPAPVVQSTIARSESAPRVSPATLKADNDLLSAIDGELRANEPTAASTYGLNVAAHGIRTRSNGTINE